MGNFLRIFILAYNQNTYTWWSCAHGTMCRIQIFYHFRIGDKKRTHFFYPEHTAWAAAMNEDLSLSTYLKRGPFMLPVLKNMEFWVIRDQKHKAQHASRSNTPVLNSTLRAGYRPPPLLSPSSSNIWGIFQSDACKKGRGGNHVIICHAVYPKKNEAENF